MINVMDEYVSFSKKCFHKYLKLILDKEYDKKISEEFITSYIDVRYSNYLDEAGSKLSIERKINKALDNTLSLYTEDKSKLLASYVREFASYFYTLEQLYLLESQRDAIDKIYELRGKLLNIEDSTFVAEFNSILREDIRKRKEYLNNFESETFGIRLKPMVKGKKLFKVSLENSIKFPDLYSQDAIMKVASKDNVSEDLTQIALLQVSAFIINDLVASSFENVYFVDMPISLFDKKSKTNRLFEIVDNPFIQEHLDIVITYECFNKYKGSMLELMRKGFVFAIYLDETFNYSSENIEYLEAFDKILLNSDKYYYKDMRNNGKIGNRIISVDEVK